MPQEIAHRTSAQMVKVLHECPDIDESGIHSPNKWPVQSIMQTISTNIPSLGAQRSLGTSQAALANSLQRLSSGLRINSAKDDAAGLGISERMSAQIRGLNQAMRNTNDGLSLAQTGQGALAEMTNNLQRIRELAIQAANATNSAADRAALSLEVQQRLEEIDRVASQTSFNERKILDGTFGNALFQVGANVGETINLSLGTNTRTNSIGSLASGTGTNSVGNDLTAAAVAFGTAAIATTANKSTAGANTYGSPATGVYSGVSSTEFDGSNFTINGNPVASSTGYAGTSNGQDKTSAYAKAEAINSSGIDGVTAIATTELAFGPTGGTASSTDFLAMWSQGSGFNKGLLDYKLSINGVQVLTFYEDFSTSSNVQTSLAATTHGLGLTAAIASINNHSDKSGVVASQDANGNLKLLANDGRNVEISESIIADVQGVHPESSVVRSPFSEITQTGWLASTVQTHTYRGQITLKSTDDIEIDGTGTTAAGFTAPGTIARSGSLASGSVGNTSDANDMIYRVDSALNTISDMLSAFGAIQNRFESTINNLMTTSESLSASRSRIRDADFAQETANLTRAQILQQTGTAILAQANGLPNNILALLR